MRQITADRSIPLIADEVQTGVGRTGAFWAVEHSGITPDVMVLSKAIGGSLPAGRHRLPRGTRRLAARRPRGHLPRQPARHGGRHGHPRLRPREPPRRAGRRRSARACWANSGDSQRTFACIGDVRGRGLMIGVEMVDTPKPQPRARPCRGPRLRYGGLGLGDGPPPAPAPNSRPPSSASASTRSDRRTRRPPQQRRTAAPAADHQRRAGVAVLDRLADAVTASRATATPADAGQPAGTADGIRARAAHPPIPRPRHTSAQAAPPRPRPDTLRRAATARHRPPLLRPPPPAEPSATDPARTPPRNRHERHPRTRRPFRTPDEPRGAGAPAPVPLGRRGAAQGGAPGHRAAGRPAADPLEHPDPHIAAQAAAVENLLRCWVRETDLAAPGQRRPAHPAPRQRHRPPRPRPVLVPDRLAPLRPSRPRRTPPTRAPPVDAVTLAALLTPRDRPDTGRQGCHRRAAGTARGGRRRPRRPRRRLRPPHRRLPARPPHPPRGRTDLFLAAEQALLLGHPLHPTPKSREGLSEAEARRYSPELRGSFPLHWMAVAPSLLATDSAWTERGRPVPADAAHRTTRRGRAAPARRVRGACPCTPGRPRDVRHRARGRRPAGRRTPARPRPARRTRGTPPPPSEPSTAPAPPPCSSCRWACASPTPAGRTSARNSTAASRSTACCAADWRSSGRPPTPASTSSATRPGSPSTGRTDGPCPAST